MAIFCSTVIPTIGRPSLSRAVWSVLDQGPGDGFEVIVVNDSGRPLPPVDWQSSPRVRVIDTNRRERSVARNAGAAIARGGYLHFLDDDDWMLPGALGALRALATATAAGWVIGGSQFVDNRGEAIGSFLPDASGDWLIRSVVGEWLPLQASLVRADAFFQVGGFAPLESLQGGDEDVDLARKILVDHAIASTARLVAAIRRGEETSTTNYAGLIEQSRQSRENVLAMADVFGRLCGSADSWPAEVAYWRGRVLAAYLGSTRWNLRRGRALVAASRALYALAAVSTSTRHLARGAFWAGAVRQHVAADHSRAVPNLAKESLGCD